VLRGVGWELEVGFALVTVETLVFLANVCGDHLPSKPTTISDPV
jgi:hypothetical protein